MKLKIRKKLALEGAKPVAGIMGKDSGLSDSGKYLVVEANKDGLSFSVHRSDIIGKSTIESKKIPAADGKSLMEIDKQGRFVTDGSFLFGLLSKGTAETDFEVSFDPESAKATGKKAAKEEEEPEADEGEASEESPKELQTIATAKVTTSSLKATLGCVEDKMPPFKALDTKKKVSFKADTLAQALSEVSIAAGKSTMNADFTNVKISVSGGYAEFATTNGQQLAIGKIMGVDGDFSCVVPFAMIKTAVASADPTRNVTLCLTSDERVILVSYPLVYGGEDVGLVEYQIARFERFAKYENKINNINKMTSCKVKTEAFKEACDVLGIVDVSRTRLKVDVGGKKITFQKTESRGSLDEFNLDLEEADGKDVEICVSTAHLQEAVSKAQQDHVELVFSGRNSLCKIKFADFEQYFAPFTEA